MQKFLRESSSYPHVQNVDAINLCLTNTWQFGYFILSSHCPSYFINTSLLTYCITCRSSYFCLINEKLQLRTTNINGYEIYKIQVTSIKVCIGGILVEESNNWSVLELIVIYLIGV